MKTLTVVLLALGITLTAQAQKPADLVWQNRYWLENVTLPAGSYQSTRGYIEIAKGVKVTIPAGCTIENSHFRGLRDVTFEMHESFFRSGGWDLGLGGKLTATNCAFENGFFQMNGSETVPHWSVHWTFENCVFAKSTLPFLNVSNNSVRANRCTFEGVNLPGVLFGTDPAEEAQSESLKFTGCIFRHCQVSESFLSLTSNCVFEDCKFAERRERWDKASHPILVTANVMGRTATPQSYENGNLKVIFRNGPLSDAGSTTQYTFNKLGQLNVPAAFKKGNWTALGTNENRPPDDQLAAYGFPPSEKRRDTNPTATDASNAPAAPATPAVSPETQTLSSALVKTYRNSLVFVTGSNGAGSGFFAKYATGNFLFTNAHVAAGVKGATFKTLDGTEVKVGAASSAVGHDVFLMAATTNGEPFEIMKDVDQNTTIGDDVVVLGNAEGAGVINTITGKIVGIGPQLVEVDAPFQPGNSGSPIVHLKSGKVIGLATYAVIHKYDPLTKQPIKDPVIRRFGYRLDSIKSWQPANWQTFFAQAAEMESIEQLTTDLANFLNDLASTKKGIHPALHSNPAIKNRLDAWLADRTKRLSPRDAATANESLISYLKIACQTDIAAARQHITYDYFQRALANQQKEREEIVGVFNQIIQNLRAER